MDSIYYGTLNLALISPSCSTLIVCLLVYVRIRPLVIIGKGAAFSRAGPELQTFVEVRALASLTVVYISLQYKCVVSRCSLTVCT